MTNKDTSEPERLLERVAADCRPLQKQSNGTPKFNLFQIETDLFSAIGYFELIYHNLLTHPRYDIDRGIDYEEWADFDAWDPTHIYGGDEAGEKYDLLPANELRDKVAYYINLNMTPTNWTKEMRENEIFVILEGLKCLHILLVRINDLIKESPWDNHIYAQMVEDILQAHKAPKKSLDPNFIAFNKWKGNHQDIDEDMYKRCLADVLLKFLKTDFIQYDVTEIDKDRAEAIFKDSGIGLLCLNLSDDERDELKRKYYKLRKLVGFENGRFDFSKKGKLGFHIYHYRHKISQDGIDGLVRFMQITEFIYEDLDMYNSGESLNETEELKCPFCEEQIENCIIKMDAKIWLTVIYNYRDELAKNKSLWLSVYAVLVSYNTIDDNVRSFCNMVMVYFEQKLDNSNISREWKKIKGEKIEKWETTQRNERRVSLAKEMSERYRKIKATL